MRFVPLRVRGEQFVSSSQIFVPPLIRQAVWVTAVIGRSLIGAFTDQSPNPWGNQPVVYSEDAEALGKIERGSYAGDLDTVITLVSDDNYHLVPHYLINALAMTIYEQQLHVTQLSPKTAQQSISK